MGGGWGPSFPDEVWEHIFDFLISDADRNAASLVCRSWHRIDRFSRRSLFVGNCYAVSPTAVVSRFPALRSVALKGKPHFADFDLMPPEWGGGAGAWIAALATGCPQLEELRMKRMVVPDDALELISRSFERFRVLKLVTCEGFSTAGLASMAANCRNLTVLDLQENVMEYKSEYWLSHFPESFNSLVALNISCLQKDVNLSSLERLVSRCTNLKTLRLNQGVPLDRLVSLLHRAPRLVEIGTGDFSGEFQPEKLSKVESAFAGCNGLEVLSGFWDANPAFIPAVYTACNSITSLNLSDATLRSADLTNLVSRCKNIQRLWLSDFIEDDGLEAISASCKHLKELRVLLKADGAAPVTVTERGLVAISAGCPLLDSVLYFCSQMTNAALFAIANNSPNLTRFRLCIVECHKPDHLTSQPFDAGFGAIVRRCRGLKRLSISGLLTDQVFKYIGQFADRLEMLSVAFAGNSDAGLHYILSGCKSLRKLEIRDCPFGDTALLANASKLETMRSLWMSACAVSLGACRLLARKIPGLNVEVIEDDASVGGSRPDEWLVEKLYIYRSVAGPRSDVPPCVWMA